MAVQTRAARLAIAGISDYEKDLNLDSLSQELVELKLFKRKNRIKTGKKGTAYEWKVVTARGSVDEMAAEARANFTPVNPGVNLSLTNDGYKTADLIHETDLEEAGGAQQIFDIVEQRTQWMPEALGAAWCTDLHKDGTDTTYGTNPITGTTGAIITTGSYGGQNVATETALQGQVLSGGLHASFSSDPFPSLRASIHACVRGTDAGQGLSHPDVVICDYDNMGYILDAANDLRQSVRYEMNTDLGVETVRFMGVEIIPSRFSPSLRNTVLTTKYIEFHTPYPTLFQTRKKEEISPVSIPMLCFVYGKLVFKLLRPHARVTTA